jgi:hypothetical protein
VIVPLRYNKQNQPEPMGVRAAAVRMALIIAAETKGEPLTADDIKMVTAAVGFVADEYARIATANDQLTATNHELTLERRREADGGELDDA